MAKARSEFLLDLLLYNLALNGVFFGPGLNDIVDGTNGGPSAFGGLAGYRYDNCTGWGTMLGENFAYSVLTSPSGSGTPPAMPRGLNGTAKRTTAEVQWTAVPNAAGYLMRAEYSTGTFTANTTSFATRGTKAALKGLIPNTVYSIVMTALNQNGSAANSIYLTTSK